jgi:hypothetical protein
MGLTYAQLTLSNPRETQLQPLVVRALADTRSTYVCVPEHVAIQLRLETLYQREVTIADGSGVFVPSSVRWRCTSTAALVSQERWSSARK